MTCRTWAAATVDDPRAAAPVQRPARAIGKIGRETGARRARPPPILMREVGLGRRPRVVAAGGGPKALVGRQAPDPQGVGSAPAHRTIPADHAETRRATRGQSSAPGKPPPAPTQLRWGGYHIRRPGDRSAPRHRRARARAGETLLVPRPARARHRRLSAEPAARSSTTRINRRDADSACSTTSPPVIPPLHPRDEGNPMRRDLVPALPARPARRRRPGHLPRLRVQGILYAGPSTASSAASSGSPVPPWPRRPGHGPPRAEPRQPHARPLPCPSVHTACR